MFIDFHSWIILNRDLTHIAFASQMSFTRKVFDVYSCKTFIFVLSQYAFPYFRIIGSMLNSKSFATSLVSLFINILSCWRFTSEVMMLHNSFIKSSFFSYARYLHGPNLKHSESICFGSIDISAFFLSIQIINK